MRHSFIDSNNVVNGQTYYYAVTSYDRGSASLQIAPSECSKLITVNPERNETFLDVNTVKIIPRPPASGYEPGKINNDFILHSNGKATGSIKLNIIDEMAIEDLDTFIVTFQENPIRYSVEDTKYETETYIAKINKFISLEKTWINNTSFELKDLEGSVSYQMGIDYELDNEFGSIKAIPNGNLIEGSSYRIKYTYWPIKNSKLLNGEQSNPIFDGLNISVQANELALDQSKSGWTNTSNCNSIYSITPYNGNNDYVPADMRYIFILQF